MRLKNIFTGRKRDEMRFILDGINDIWLDVCEESDTGKVSLWIAKLIKYKAKNYKAEPYVDCLIHNFKKFIRITDEEYPDRKNTRRHKMSDHAFVRAIELLYDFDINELKDKAIKECGDKNFKFITAGKGKIVTVVPDRWRHNV